jgi:hypothetical protein
MPVRMSRAKMVGAVMLGLCVGVYWVMSYRCRAFHMNRYYECAARSRISGSSDQCAIHLDYSVDACYFPLNQR